MQNMQRNKMLQQQQQKQAQQERNRLLQQQQQQIVISSNATNDQLQPGLQNIGSLLNDAVAPNVTLQVSFCYQIRKRNSTETNVKLLTNGFSCRDRLAYLTLSYLLVIIIKCSRMQPCSRMPRCNKMQ